MKNSRNFKQVISIVLISSFLMYLTIGMPAQSEDEVVRQFQRIKNGYNSGQYSSARVRIERVINIIFTKKIPRNDILGGCYLLLGAISEKEEKLTAAEEYYRRAKEKYSIIGVEGVDLNLLPLYKQIVKGVAPDTKGTIEIEKKTGKKKFPWLLAAAGVVAAGIILYFLVFKKKKKTLSVILDEGVNGSPGPGIYTYKKGETLQFNYTAQNGFSELKVFLDSQEYSGGGSGTIKMDRDHTLSVSTKANDVQIITDKDSLEVLEGGDVVLNIQLSAQPKDIVDVAVTYLSGDTDVWVKAGENLTFTPTNWQNFKSVLFKSETDTDYESEEAVFRISASVQTIVEKDISIKIIDSDRLSFLTSTDQITLDEGKSTVLNVWLSAKPSTPITAYVNRVSGDSDIVVQSGNQLTFTPNNWNVPQKVILGAIADSDTFNDKAEILIEAPGTSAQAKTINVQVLDEKGLNFYVDREEIIVEEGGTASFTVKLKAQPQNEIIASITPISGDNDISVESGNKITFTPSNWNNPHRVTLQAAEDDDIENGQTIIRIDATEVAAKLITAVENDNDSIAFQFSSTEVTVEEGGTGTFGVKLSAKPSDTITATAKPYSGDSDISVQPGTSLEFTPENWDTEKMITLIASKDEDEENGETTIAVSAPKVATGTILARENDNYRGNPPEVSISSPMEGDTIGEDITIKTVASDDFGVSRVEFYIDDVLKEADSTQPYRYDWSVKDIPTGVHQIKVIAYDSIDQQAQDEISVNVIDMLPEVSIQAPDVTPLTGNVTINTKASDSKGVIALNVYLDDNLIASWELGPETQVDFSFVLDTAKYSNGSHILKAIAIDTANQQSEPAEIKIIIENF